MDNSDPLAIRYQTVRGFTERVLNVAESLSFAFDRWTDTYVRGRAFISLL